MNINKSIRISLLSLLALAMSSCGGNSNKESLAERSERRYLHGLFLNKVGSLYLRNEACLHTLRYRSRERQEGHVPLGRLEGGEAELGPCGSERAQRQELTIGINDEIVALVVDNDIGKAIDIGRGIEQGVGVGGHWLAVNSADFGHIVCGDVSVGSRRSKQSGVPFTRDLSVASFCLNSKRGCECAAIASVTAVSREERDG